MGLNTTSTMASSRSFGLARGRKRVLTSYTFPSGTSTWTAPSGVTNINQAIGKGSDGNPAYWSEDSYISIFVGPDCGSYTNVGPTLSWSTVNAAFNSIINWSNTLSSSGQTSTRPNTAFFWCASANTWRRYDSNWTATWRRTGGAWNNTYASNTGDVPTSTYTNLSIFGGTIGRYIAGSNGSATTGFGRSFPGGVEGPASNTTYTDIAVTPGTQYTIVNNGSLSIEYYA